MNSLRRRILRATALAALIVLAGWFIFTQVNNDGSTPAILATALAPWIPVGAAVTAVVALIARARLYAVLSLVLVLFAGITFAVFPQWPAAIPADAPRITVFALNAYVQSADATSVIDAIRDADPDVVMLSEMGEINRAAYIEAGLAEMYPYSYFVDDELWLSGGDIWSKTPLANPRRIEGGTFPLLAAETTVNGVTVTVVSSHMYSPLSNRDRWRADHLALGDFVASMAGSNLIIGGDFNASRGHGPFDSVRNAGLIDAAEQTLWGFQRTSWPHEPAPLPVLTLDHVLASDNFVVESTEFYGVAGTDHRAIVARLALP